MVEFYLRTGILLLDFEVFTLLLRIKSMLFILLMALSCLRGLFGQVFGDDYPSLIDSIGEIDL